MGDPNRRQGPVRKLVVLDHRVTGCQNLIHHHGSLCRHGREGALVILRVNPFHVHGHDSSPLPVVDEHLLSGSHVTGERRRPRGVLAGDKDEVRSSEGDLLARLGLDHVEGPPGGGVSVYEHDEVGEDRVSVAVRSQDSVPGLEVSDLLLGAVLQGDCGGSRETAT